MHDDTKLSKAGTNAEKNFGIMNPPIYRASTIHFPTLKSFNSRFDRRFDEIVYGSYGTPTTKSLESAIADLENASRSIVVGSGTAAITLTFMACVKPGDHIVVSDGVYKSTRTLCETLLARLNVTTSYFRPDDIESFKTELRPETSLVFLESPSSFTFETHDIPAITKICRKRNILTAIDNTWASPLYFKPLDNGVDISTQAATKYLSGHSDVMMGSISIKNENLHQKIRDTAIQFGNNVSPTDCYLALRGMRTMGIRLRQHQETALKLVEWLIDQPEVDNILYPAWPSDPGYKIWKRDFSGAAGFFGVVLMPIPTQNVAKLVEGMSHFRICASWGVFECLLIPSYPVRSFAKPPWTERGPLLRIHAGLEDARDLIRDLKDGFSRLALKDYNS